jgi:ABC-type lipoprotein export system ATPase subunit
MSSNTNTGTILDIPLKDLLKLYPYAMDFFIPIRLTAPDKLSSVQNIISALPDDFFEDLGLGGSELLVQFEKFISEMEIIRKNQKRLQSITIKGGHDKSGNKENIELSIKTGEIICVIGPTGSGKSRLLSDIECLAQNDTPTGRKILINGKVPDKEKRFSSGHKIVAQLSQNMNFVMDINVSEFIRMHAESRMIENPNSIINKIIQCANELSGESFAMDCPLTQLSGGQSRALMIADTALLSPLPVVLIDELENAGIDRSKALDLLIKGDKIVLISTHDPILALMGDKRIIIKNGGINRIIEKNGPEQKNLAGLKKIDSLITALRGRIRSGELIDFDINEYFK